MSREYKSGSCQRSATAAQRFAKGKQVALLVAAWIAATRKKDSSRILGKG